MENGIQSFEEKDHTYIDDKLVWKKDKKAWT